jgi:ketosteroid isomerase-like protein
MKPILLFALPWLSLLAAATPSAPPSPATPPSAAALVEAERAFARDAAARGTRSAFLEWLAPTGVVFRPGPVNGWQAYEASKRNNAVLSWEPAYAAISDAGDLGWTTGPWALRPDRGRNESAWGEYLSVWRRQADGRHLVALDVGISHEEHAAPAGEPVFLAPADAPRTGRGPLDRRRSLWKADADYGALAKQAGVATALERFGAERLILLREGMPRVTGLVAACDTLRSRERRATLMSLAQFLSASGDLGYTYGSFVSGEPAARDSGYYVHVWHRGRTKPWELAVEFVQPLPRPGKK